MHISDSLYNYRFPKGRCAMKIIKSVICLILCACTALVLCSCGTGRVALESAVDALKMSDFDELSECVTDDSMPFVRSLEGLCAELDEGREIYDRLMEFVRVSYSGEDEKTDDGEVLSVTLTHVDFAALMSDVAAEISVFGDSAWNVIEGLIDKGEFERTYLSETKHSVKMIYSDGKWILPLDAQENASLKIALDTSDFLRWLVARQK